MMGRGTGGDMNSSMVCTNLEQKVTFQIFFTQMKMGKFSVQENKKNVFQVFLN